MRRASPRSALSGALRRLRGTQQRDRAQFQRRRGLYLAAALVGLATGLVVTVFRLLLAALERDFPALPGWLRVLVPALGLTLSVAALRLAPIASGSGIPQLKAVLHHLRPFAWGRVLPVKFLGGLLAMGSGVPLGREGPSVQMGGALGAMIASVTRATPARRLTLIAAGAGAGLAAAFNAPLAGLTFVLEELQRDFTPLVFTAALLAAALSDAVTRLLAGQTAVFVLPAFASPPTWFLPAFALLGILLGVLGVVFNRALLWALTRFDPLRGGQKLLPVTLGLGLALGALGLAVPAALGSGHSVVERAAGGALPLGLALLWLLTRFVVTPLVYAPGTPGGIFAPLLVIGALAGSAFGVGLHALFPDALPGVYAVVGMAALFSGVVRAPLTAVVLIVEMTGSYSLMLPLITACFAAYATAERLRDPPIYDALLERDLHRSGAAPALDDILEVGFKLQPGAAYDGLLVRELGLPAGCTIVDVLRGGGHLVPRGDTRLQAGDQLSVRIAPEAHTAHAQLLEGTRQRG